MFLIPHDRDAFRRYIDVELTILFLFAKSTRMCSLKCSVICTQHVQLIFFPKMWHKNEKGIPFERHQNSKYVNKQKPRSPIGAKPSIWNWAETKFRRHSDLYVLPIHGDQIGRMFAYWVRLLWGVSFKFRNKQTFLGHFILWWTMLINFDNKWIGLHTYCANFFTNSSGHPIPIRRKEKLVAGFKLENKATPSFQEFYLRSRKFRTRLTRFAEFLLFGSLFLFVAFRTLQK
jgi:hypothetical protein